jgi:cytochrome b subunit of formate dehydrogenase
MAFALSVLLLSIGASGALAEESPCLDCHEVDADEVGQSVHGFLECVDCHPKSSELPHLESVSKADCESCHPEIVEEYEEGIHGQMTAAGELAGQGCEHCHGRLHTLKPSSDVESPVHPQRLAETCGSCHANPEIAEKYEFSLVRPLAAYSESVHARAVQEGLNAATCNDCHGTHAIFLAVDPRSMVNHHRVPETCGGCHPKVTEIYERSVHGQAAAHGIRESPVCTDCHGEHRIVDPHHPDSPVYASNIPKLTCGRCHADLRLSEKFGLAENMVPAYADSYHGLAVESGMTTVANCASCHGVHDILPSSDPRAHTNPDNLPETCGQCHPGAGERFALGPVHVLPTEPEHVAVYWIRRIYLWLIFLVIGGMVLHNGLDFYHKVRHPPLRPPPSEVVEEERMVFGFRLAHWLLVFSFAVLVYTGFALKYSETWWAEPLLQWESTLGLRGWLHRGAAVVMLLAAAVHIFHLATSRPARVCIAGMWPTFGDLREVSERLGFLLGRRVECPVAAKLGYAEKMEYLAVIWGTVVMVVTGFALWFDDLVLRWLPKWVLDVATVIHFYEAILASLAILVWHLYFVIFDPVVYPMDPAWLTGRSAPGRVAERHGEAGNEAGETAIV